MTTEYEYEFKLECTITVFETDEERAETHLLEKLPDFITVEAIPTGYSREV